MKSHAVLLCIVWDCFLLTGGYSQGFAGMCDFRTVISGLQIAPAGRKARHLLRIATARDGSRANPCCIRSAGSLQDNHG